MFPAMVFCILSSDRDFVDDMTCLLCDAGVDVYVASSFDEYAALQADGVALEMLVLDPVFRIRD